jgi:hypothetical protein
MSKRCEEARIVGDCEWKVDHGRPVIVVAGHLSGCAAMNHTNCDQCESVRSTRQSTIFAYDCVVIRSAVNERRFPQA